MWATRDELEQKHMVYWLAETCPSRQTSPAYGLNLNHNSIPFFIWLVTIWILSKRHSRFFLPPFLLDLNLGTRNSWKCQEIKARHAPQLSEERRLCPSLLSDNKHICGKWKLPAGVRDRLVWRYVLIPLIVGSWQWANRLTHSGLPTLFVFPTAASSQGKTKVRLFSAASTKQSYDEEKKGRKEQSEAIQSADWALGWPVANKPRCRHNRRVSSLNTGCKNWEKAQKGVRKGQTGFDAYNDWHNKDNT